MKSTRRQLLRSAPAMAALSAMQPLPLAGQAAAGAVRRYVRFQRGGATQYGLLEGDQIRVLTGNLFGDHRMTGDSVALRDAKLLYPCEPRQVLACGLNYRSHLGNATPPSRPEIFLKPVSCLQNPGDPIRIPPGAKNVHYEGEIVIVVGKDLHRATKEEAAAAIFGVTCGNDVSERDWQSGADKDLQWWRAKGSDTFGCLGPAIARGLNYGDVQLETRLNGATVQKQRTSDLMFDLPSILVQISRYMRVYAGDVVYTGTPGQTRPMKPGDVVEVEIEGIGVLRNPVVAG